jgi:hypothetical protein
VDDPSDLTHDRPEHERGGRERFAFAFDPRFRAPLSVLGVRPSTCAVTVGPNDLDVRFGPWRVVTGLDNVVDLQVTGPYNRLKVIGPRASAADRGLTFGSDHRAGLCICFREPVPGLFGRLVPHPGLTVTVLDVEGLAASLRARCPALRDDGTSG